MRAHVAVVLALLAAATTLTHAQTLLYVDRNADQEPHDGSDWCHAHLELREALAEAQGNPGIATIRVADGTYTPTAGTDRTTTFQLADGLSLEGGYAGCNDGGDLRDLVLYETILSGDIGTQGDNTDNCHHVVTGNGTGSTAILDGFTVRDGNANGSDPYDRGGGMYSVSSGDGPTVRYCTFTENTARDRAGAMYNGDYSALTITDCTFIGNSAGNRAGAMFNDNYSSTTITNCAFVTNTVVVDGGDGGAIYSDPDSSPILTCCTFTANSARDDGAGMYSASSSPTLTHCTFTQNVAAGSGAAIFNLSANSTITHCAFIENLANGTTGGGGVLNSAGSVSIANCTFRGNSASSDGGGMLNIGGHPTVANSTFIANSVGDDGAGIYGTNNSGPTVVNCTFCSNSAAGTGGAIFSDTSSNSTVANCILWDNAAPNSPQIHGPVEVTFSCVQGCYDGAGNIDADPRFVDADGPDGLFGTDDDDLRLRLVSPCVDVGDNSAVPPEVDTDLAGNLRFVDAPQTPDSGHGIPPLVDMGAYEFQPANLADLDGDGDVDVADFNLFQLAFTGPLAP